MIKYVELDGIPFAIDFEWKRVKNINLRIRGDGSIHISAPYRVSMKTVDKFIYDHKEFIFSTINRINQRNDEKVDYTSLADGSSVKVYGKAKTLRIVDGINDSVTETDDEVILTTPYPNDEERIFNIRRL